MADLIGPILEVINFIGRPIKKYLNYHRKFHYYVDDFTQARADLNDRKEDVKQKLEDEQRFDKRPKREVESWFKKVEEKTNLAQAVEEKVSKGKYIFRSCLGKQVDLLTQEIREVHDEGHFPDGLVATDTSATKLELPTEEIVGSADSVEKIYDYLMNDEVGKIGVWGMGGIGKTTLVKNVYNKLSEEGKFNKLIWTTVSQDFDILRLQKSIASQLKEYLADDDDTIIRAAKLSAMLKKQGKYVLILDDVWKSFTLSDCGIPEPKREDGCKLVLTTREKDVVRSLGCKQVEVRHLSEDEAMQLFVSKVGCDVLSNSMIKPTMKLIVEECSGLPLAIVTVAGSMKGIIDPFIWRNALSELQSHVRSIQVSEDKVFGCLKFSYDHLDPKLRPCFLCCALYPEDYEIEKADIIEHWLEEGLIDQMGTRKAMHNRCHFYLRRLEESCLLERVGDGDHIKMHDLVRDMALRITEVSPRFFVKAGLQLTELSEYQLTEDVENISFMRNNIGMIPLNLFPSKCLKLTSLLFSNNSLKEIPHTLFDHMPNLKILDVSSNYQIVTLPHSLSNLVNLTSLLLSHCSRLEKVPSLAKLVALKKLDLQNTGITEVPRGLEVLINLRYLNLGYTRRLEQIPDGIFMKLVHLQHLLLYPASLREEEIRELKNLELLIGKFTHIRGFSMFVGNKKSTNEYLFVCLMTPNILSIFDGRGYSTLYSQVDIAKMIAFIEVDINVEDSISVPSDIRQLELKSCSKVRSADDIGGLKDATDLRKCIIIRCNSLEYLFLSWCAPLQTLEYLKLVDLNNLKKLVAESGPPPPGIFSSLKEILLIRAHGLQKLFSTISFLQHLHNLELFQLNGCRNMEEIIASEEEEQEMLNANNSVEFMLPKLRRLELWNLPKLKSICSRNVIMICNSLEEIEISRCRKLERIPLYFSSLDNTQQPSIPPYLEKFKMHTEDKQWWECVEWDVHPNAKNVLHPIIEFTDSQVLHI